MVMMPRGTNPAHPKATDMTNPAIPATEATFRAANGWTDTGRVLAQPEGNVLEVLMEDTGNVWKWLFDGHGGWVCVETCEDPDEPVWISTVQAGVDAIRCTVKLAIVDAFEFDF